MHSSVNKLKESISNKTLFMKGRRKLHQLCPLYYIKKQSLQEKQLQEVHYRKLLRQHDNDLKEYVASDKQGKRAKIIWVCWFQGLEQAPELIKCCINSMKEKFKGYEVVILTEENIKDYTHFPEYIYEKRAKGYISHAHYSDLIRVELLCQHGGIWIDATVLCTFTDFPKYMEESDLFVFKSLDLSKSNCNPIVASSWFISAKTENNILLLTRYLLFKYWKKNDVLIDYFLFHLFFSIACNHYKTEWENIPMYNNHAPHVLQFELNNEYDEYRWNDITKISPVHKLNHHIKYDINKFTNYKFILENYK